MEPHPLANAPRARAGVLEGRGPLAARLSALSASAVRHTGTVRETDGESRMHDRESAASLQLVHVDVVPRALADRIFVSSEVAFSLVEPSLARTVGLVVGDLPPRTEPALLAFVRAHLARGLLVLPYDRSCSLDSALDANVGFIELAAPAGGATFRIFVSVDALAPAERSARPARAVAIPLVLSVRCARSLVSAKELRELDVGDVLLTDEADERLLIAELPESENELLLRACDERWCFAGYRPRRPLLETPMPDPRPTLAPIDAARVEVSVELARITTTLGELDQLAEGAVISAAVPTDSPVTLRVGGVAIARGVLVRVGDELGVRIVEVVETGPGRSV